MNKYILSLLALVLTLVGVGNASADTTLWSNYTPSGSTFSQQTSIDFTKQSIKAEIDLSTCSSSNTWENILSIGTGISEWYGYYNVHLYYTASTKTLQLNYVSQSTQSVQNNITLSSTDLTVELSSAGLSINGEVQSSYGATALSSLLSQTSVTVGSTQGDTRSYATYKSVVVTGSATTTTTYVTPTAGNTYYIVPSTDATKALTAASAAVDANLNMATKAETTMFQWQCVTSLSSTHPYLFKLAAASTLAIDMACNAASSKNPLIWTDEYSYNNLSNVNQEFQLESTGDGDGTYYMYVTYQNTKYYLAWNSGSTTLTRSNVGQTKFGFVLASTGGNTGGNETTGDHGSFSVSWISDQSVVGKYKEDAHATYIPYTSVSEMQADADFYATPWVQPTSSDYILLNSDTEWKFKYTAGTAGTPGSHNYYAKDLDDSSWSTIRVPLSWEMANHGKPVYTNVGYPFSSNAPNANTGMTNYGVTDHNATGFYRRTITIPDTWSSKRVFLHFDGAYSAIVVWLNGKFVGFSEGSNTDAEFDLSGFATTGDNQLSVCVYRWCDGSYLEGQDMWHLSGIHRDVYLVAKPKVFVRDHVITASNLNSDATSGKLNVALTIDNRNGASASKTFDVSLLDATGKQVATGSGTYSGTANSTTVNVDLGTLSNLTPWSAENPYLYTVIVSQKDGGTEEMAFSTKYGFRNITKSNNQILINGKRVFFKGVNTQDTHPEYGRAIDTETMLKDVTLMKQANVNTVRTSHYPRQPKMYAMFDHFGLYCMDEADVECHYVGTNISSNSSWQTAMNDRNERMVRRDRNHPSVIFWSLGNECGAGSNFSGVYNLVKNLDSSRFIHNEQNQSYSDLGSSMYPSVSSVQNSKSGYNNMPYFICEYEHAMGNSLGLLKEYWDAIESSTGIIGGCIWDWVEQAIYDPSKLPTTTDANGFGYYTAGYDYNTANTNSVNYGFQGNFMDNGIINPDRAWSAELSEVKGVYKYVDFQSFSSGTLTLKNKYAFTNLNAFDLHYRVLRDGYFVEEGKATVPSIEPGNTGTVSISYTEPTDKSAEYVIHFYLTLKNAEAWAEQGYAVAEGEFTLNTRSTSLASKSVSGGSLSVSVNTVSGTTPEGKSFSYSFSNGKASSWTFDDKSLLTSGFDFNNYRDIDNDRSISYGFTSSSSVSVTSSLQKSGNNATMTVKGTSNSYGSYTIDYTFYPDATIDMVVNFSSRKNTRRIGLGVQFASGFEDVEYYGRGPWANYVDRKTGSYLGRYSTTVDDLLEEFMHPQTNGDHQDLRELVLTNPTNGTSLKIQTAGQVAFSLSHYDETKWCDTGDSMWYTKLHWYDLTKQSQVYAHFDSYQIPLGCNSCSGDNGLTYYQIPSNGSYSLRLTPSAE